MRTRRGPRVFLSYRRSETSYPTAGLYEALVVAFGAENVFRDVDALRPGDDFGAEIERAVASCDVLLVMIGPQWATLCDDSGRRRLDDPDDLVRLEIGAALRGAGRVVPVLVGGTMPTVEDLPGELAGLARRHAASLDPRQLGADTRRLVEVIAASAGQDRGLVVPGASVASVELGAPEESIAATLGPADQVVTDAGTGEVEHTYYDRGLQAYSLDGVVGGFFLVGLPEDGFTASSACTVEGIGAGSSRGDVEAAFGPPDRLDRATGGAAFDAACYRSRGITFCYPASWGDRWSAPVAAVVVVPPTEKRHSGGARG